MRFFEKNKPPAFPNAYQNILDFDWGQIMALDFKEFNTFKKAILKHAPV